MLGEDRAGDGQARDERFGWSELRVGVSDCFGDDQREPVGAGEQQVALVGEVAVRFWGSVAAVKHAVPRMCATGSISVTSGTVGVRPVPGFATHLYLIQNGFVTGTVITVDGGSVLAAD